MSSIDFLGYQSDHVGGRKSSRCASRLKQAANFDKNMGWRLAAEEEPSSSGGGGAFIVGRRWRRRGEAPGVEELAAAAWIRCC